RAARRRGRPKPGPGPPLSVPLSQEHSTNSLRTRQEIRAATLQVGESICGSLFRSRIITATDRPDPRFAEALALSDTGSVSQWIVQLKVGDHAVAQNLWEAYYGQLVQRARQKLLRGAPRRAADESDVAL